MPNRHCARPVLLAITLGCASACGSNADPKASSSDAGKRSDAANPNAAQREVSCVDQSFQALMLFDTPNQVAPKDESALPANQADQARGVFHTLIDTTAGGLSPSQSFVYARFNEHGLDHVAISDEAAFASLAWDVAVRRYVIRLNSGVSGPGDVTGARTRPKTDFDSLTSVPDDLDYRTEQYFDDSCDYLSDGSGIGAPATALASFWSYSACVAMTHNVYVLALPMGRHVKLEVLSYYTPDNQQTCDQTGMVPTPSGAGNLRIRWAYLD